MTVRSMTALLVLASASAANAGNPVFIRSNVSDLWGQFGQVNAMNDIYGGGNWQDLRFETSNPKDVFSAKNDCIMMEGGNDQADELENYLNSNQALIEGWVQNGGRLIINAAPNEGDGMNLGFGGISLNYWDGDGAGVAVDTNHPVYNGPYGQAGGFLVGSSWNHASVTGGNLSAITLNSGNGNPNLAEEDFGAGHLIVGGLTLDFFYSHPAWTQPDSQIYLKNLIEYNCRVPAPGSAALLGIAGLAAARRRR
jgi:hypothetical protein